MSKVKGGRLFDSIAPVYGLFYNMQKMRFAEVIQSVQLKMDMTLYRSVLDVGCGTGALCSVLHKKGMTVTGIDAAAGMLRVARRQPENNGITFLQASALEQLPFEEKSFDIVIASYVAHGMQKGDREKLYAQMDRLAKHKVIIHDYNHMRNPLISMIEYLEHGYYFSFIKVAEEEMARRFADVKVADVGAHAAWYICTPHISVYA